MIKSDSIRNATAALLLMAVISGVFLISLRLPPLHELAAWNVAEGNLRGQRDPAWVMSSVGLLLTIYGIKRLIVVKSPSTFWAGYFFFLLFFASIPVLWLLCEPDWFNPHIYRWMCWFGDPLAFWALPTISFLVDLSTRPTLQTFLRRSAAEIVVVFPLWMSCWVYLSFFPGGGWI